MALTSLKLSHIQLVFKQLVLLYSIRHGYYTTPDSIRTYSRGSSKRLVQIQQ